MEKKNFCVLPFNSISLDARGQLRPCCNAYDADFNEFIADLDTIDILNNKKIIQLRKDFIEDKRASVCKRCWELEDMGMTSYRTMHRGNFFKKQNVEYYLKEQINFDEVEYLDITLGNKCNLACRMCNQYSSSLYAKNLIDLGIYYDHSGKNGLINFSESDEKKILEIIRNSKNLYHIYFLGGEPLISELHDKILKLLIEIGRADQTLIQYNTNMNIDIKKYFEYWKHFKKLQINASIDGVDSTYEYIRWPGKFSKVFDNMKLATEYREQFPNMELGISVVNQNLNATNMVDLVERFEVCKIKNAYWFITVVGQNFLEMTPTHILEQQYDILHKKFEDRIPWKDMVINYQMAIDKSKNLDPKLVKEFFSKTKKFDEYRKQNLFNFLPYMKELADKFEVETW